MSHDPNHTDPGAHQVTLEEQLVAYLDGELDDESSRQVEELLATDPKVRETLEKLEGTWDLLDNLEQLQPEEILTRSTLEMVAVAAEDDVRRQQAEAPRRRRQRRLLGGVGALAAGAGGFLAVALFWPDRNETLLEDLPVIEHYDQYRQIGDFQFLERLLENKDELFGGEEGDDDS
jgi:anti-sigma factor RsiW